MVRANARVGKRSGPKFKLQLRLGWGGQARKWAPFRLDTLGSFLLTLPERVQRMCVVQHQCEFVQLRVSKALRLDRFHGGQDVVAIVAGAAVPLPDVTELIRQ